MIGQSFGRWLVLAEANERRNRKRVYLCRCECGTTRAVSGGNLRSGISKSCGCLKLERTHASKYRHGRNTSDRTYRAWSSMRNRCSNPNCQRYTSYGGRGISVCARWDAFENFLADMGECPPGLTLDRIDPNGNYEPDNCRWATRREQSLNKTTTRHVTAFGESKPLTVWAQERGLPFLLVWKRLHRGWDAERALTEPNRSTTKEAA